MPSKRFLFHRWHLLSIPFLYLMSAYCARQAFPPWQNSINIWSRWSLRNTDKCPVRWCTHTHARQHPSVTETCRCAWFNHGDRFKQTHFSMLHRLWSLIHTNQTHGSSETQLIRLSFTESQTQEVTFTPQELVLVFGKPSSSKHFQMKHFRKIKLVKGEWDGAVYSGQRWRELILTVIQTLVNTAWCVW